MTFETVLDAVASRRSWSSVTSEAPTHDELARIVAAAGRVADHSSLRPWRIVALRGDARRRLGKAIAKASKDRKPSDKPLKAPLVLAVVVSAKKSHKVPRWEQEAVASGVAHTMSLLLDAAGWGVFWRTGWYTRHKAMRKAHGLEKNEELMGWLYVGGVPEGRRRGSRRVVDAERFLTEL
ncbi:nitroreductase family protein [Labedella endophytica]|uniref:Putative NAD(P)H nitroreductase n=1 Tax=Labedella endophytica TaxID=1523160 RepID=A0A3S0VEM6_9MICO|nr:nitroreductase [Labedella endophytica]RUQ99024.1 nitroreductase [Labedella endophytica]